MQCSLAAFYEPRGVMRILQFIFAIAAFATTVNFQLNIFRQVNGKMEPEIVNYPYQSNLLCDTDSSSSAQFFVATGVLSMLYCIFIIVVYAIIDELYRTKSEFPLADFFITTILAIFWLIGSSAWSEGVSELKSCLEKRKLSFSGLNVSLLIGFLNFFLWASSLWFLYKETIWFQRRQNNQTFNGQTSTMQ